MTARLHEFILFSNRRFLCFLCVWTTLCCCFFQYIGTMEVPRPSSRVEIVAAMRKIRVSYKKNLLRNRYILHDLRSWDIEGQLSLISNIKLIRMKYYFLFSILASVGLLLSHVQQIECPRASERQQNNNFDVIFYCSVGECPRASARQ